MKYICNFSGINPRCKECHHNKEHDREMIPFLVEGFIPQPGEIGMQHCTVDGHCNIADRNVCCEPIRNEASHEM